MSARLKEVIEDINSLIKAETTILFGLEQNAQAVSIIVHSGNEKLDLSALYGLKVSPVKDVIQEGEWSYPVLEKEPPPDLAGGFLGFRQHALMLRIFA